jgi:hypothetical protein
MVDGILYVFVRNYRPDDTDDFTNARLAWSQDTGKTFNWAEWHFSNTFGCPEFIQFGPNYSGARDEYVYVVSQDNDDAYRYDECIVMARVRKDMVLDRPAYDFFAGKDKYGKPLWNRDIEKRMPVFYDPAGTQRISISYNKGLKRYFLTTSHQPKGDTRTHTAALGIFEATEPWGDWFTVYYDDHWSGNCRTYHHRFPVKWISCDGMEMWLLFSGLDCGYYDFCLRKIYFK